MVEKEGTEGEEAAKKAYKEAREEIDDDAEKAAGDKVSSALINRVRIVPISTISLSPFFIVIRAVLGWSPSYLSVPPLCRLMLCSKSLKRRLTTWMPKLATSGGCSIGILTECY